MDLFERFSSKENLKKAFLYLKEEIDESSLALDPIWKPSISAVAQLGDGFFEALQEYTRENKYQPDKADFIYADKDNMGVRPICSFSVVDRIIFQAILNPLILGNIIDKKLYSYCLGNRIAGKEHYLKPYKVQWAKFCDKQVEAFSKKLIWRAEFDIQTYYESIPIDTLLKILREDFLINNEPILKILEKQLKNWAENTTLCGVPQGATASHILANAYLYPLDIFLDDLKRDNEFDYFRYVDDTVIMAKSADTINYIVSKIVIFLRKYNLKLNTKSRLEQLKNTKAIEERKFYNPYGRINETSKQKIDKISKKILPTLRQIINGRKPDKIDVSGLNYYLKAMAGLGNPVFLDSLIAIIPKKPSLVFLICRYFGFYFSEDKNFYGWGGKSVLDKYEKIWKIYKSNSLTDWTKFWLLKVLSAPLLAKDHKDFQKEINRIIADPNAKFLRPLAFFYRAYMREQIDPMADLGFNLDDIKRHIRNANTEIEKAIYYYFLIYLKGSEDRDTIKELLYEALQAKSPEIQTMGIFLVEKLYRIPLPTLIKRHPHKRIGDKLVIDMNDKEAWDINLEAEMLGELGRIYFKLPIPTQASAKKKPDEFLTDEGKIAQDKLASFFGIPTPLKVEVK